MDHLIGNCDVGNSESDDDTPQLSSHALAALQEFYNEQQGRIFVQDADSSAEDAGNQIAEDWQLSQFWYDERTASTLANEVLKHAEECSKVACLSCPTLYRKLKELCLKDTCVKCFEYDRRFRVFGDDFVHYDYNVMMGDPPLEFQGTFHIIVADPPFLSEECLQKFAKIITYLGKENFKLLLCTGAQVEELAVKLLGVHRCEFQPQHSNNLANEFCCFANYETDL